MARVTPQGVVEFGAYTVYEQLGVGGMASVHRAESREPDGTRRQIALKRLLPHAAANSESVRAFVDEGRLASHLHHPNVAQAYDLGRIDGTYFIAMDLVLGPTLGQIIRRCIEIERKMPIRIALHLLVQMCDALDYAHNLRDADGVPLDIVHRDVSPANVIVSNTGIVKLVDFGIAKAMSRARNHTKVGFVKGKVGYIAPEYQKGKLDARADLFAVGVIAHELLASQKLFQVDNDLESLRRVRELEVHPPSRWNAEVPSDLDDIVMLALRRDPEERWQTAAALRVALHNVATSLGPIPTRSEIRDWAEALFSPSEHSMLGRVISALETPSSSSIQLSFDASAIDRSARSAFDISDVAPAPVRPPPVPPPRSASVQAAVPRPMIDLDTGVTVTQAPEASTHLLLLAVLCLLTMAGGAAVAAQLSAFVR